MRAVISSEEQVIQWITSLSNWGRWGEDDQYGCLNLITPEKRKQAAALVQDGITVSCARPITTEITPDITYQVQRYMVDSGGVSPAHPLIRSPCSKKHNRRQMTYLSRAAGRASGYWCD